MSDGTVYDKVRVIAINTNACYNFNYFLIKQRNDPGDHLKWLEETLNKMERNGEVGLIVGHIPPNSDSCLEQWATRFNALMDRY